MTDSLNIPLPLQYPYGFSVLEHSHGVRDSFSIILMKWQNPVLLFFHRILQLCNVCTWNQGKAIRESFG